MNRRQRVVERVGITAIGVDGQRTEIAAVAGADGARWNGGVGTADIADRQRIAIRICIRRGGNGRTGAAACHAQAGDDIAAGTGLLFGNRIAVIVRRRCVVGPVNGEGHGSGTGAAQTVTDGVGEDLVACFPRAQRLNHRIGGVQGIAVTAIRVQRQAPEAAGEWCSRCRRYAA